MGAAGLVLLGLSELGILPVGISSGLGHVALGLVGFSIWWQNRHATSIYVAREAEKVAEGAAPPSSIPPIAREIDKQTRASNGAPRS